MSALVVQTSREEKGLGKRMPMATATITAATASNNTPSSNHFDNLLHHTVHRSEELDNENSLEPHYTQPFISEDWLDSACSSPYIQALKEYGCTSDLELIEGDHLLPGHESEVFCAVGSSATGCFDTDQSPVGCGSLTAWNRNALKPQDTVLRPSRIPYVYGDDTNSVNLADLELNSTGAEFQDSKWTSRRHAEESHGHTFPPILLEPLEQVFPDESNRHNARCGEIALGQNVRSLCASAEPVSAPTSSVPHGITGASIQPTRRKATAMVKEWFYDHLDYPYPTNEEEAALMGKTGLSLQQIRTCFVNLRSRKLPDSIVGNQTDTNPAHSTDRVDRRINFQRFFADATKEADKFTQIEMNNDFFWDGVQLRSVLEYTMAADGLPNFDASLSNPSGSLVPRTDKSSKHEMTTSEASQSPSTSGDNRRTQIQNGRKGKRRVVPSQPTCVLRFHPATSHSKPPFYCTFCPKQLKNRYEWKRHESTHVTAVMYACMPEGTAFFNNRCAFCNLQSPSPAHFEEHNVQLCGSRPLHERTFNRKDHLKQHMKQFHHVTHAVGIPETWIRQADTTDIPPGALWCGFCMIDLESWSERVEHVSNHFQIGDNMNDWVPRLA